MFKIIFFGTSEFAVPSLRALHHDPRCEIVGVVTQPNRPVGRHAVMTAPPVKRIEGVELQQPEKLKEEPFVSWIREIGPLCDAFVVVSYGKILPQWLLDLPKHGVVNVHGSLLPRWRGPSPIQAAIAAGDMMTGVTILKLDAEMDHGPILTQAEETIRSDDTGESLHNRLAMLGAKTLPDTLADYLAKNIEPTEQDHAQSTYCKILTRDDGKIDWTKSASEIERLVRAYDPWPGTWMDVDGKRIKISEARLPPPLHVRGGDWGGSCPGTRLISNGLPIVVCGDGSALEIIRLQLEGKVAMLSKNYIRGHKVW